MKTHKQTSINENKTKTKQNKTKQNKTNNNRRENWEHFMNTVLATNCRQDIWYCSLTTSVTVLNFSLNSCEVAPQF